MNSLKDARTKAELSQQALAKKSGVSQAAISDIEAGRTPHPRIDTLQLLAKALHVPLETLLEESA